MITHPKNESVIEQATDLFLERLSNSIWIVTGADRR